MVPPDMPTAAFSVTAKAGGEVVVNVTSAQPLFRTRCSNPPVLEKADGGSWVPLQDDKPPHSNNPGYYLDGRFIHPSQNFGCDTPGCEELADEERVGTAIEYVKTGSALPPPEPHTWPDAGIPVPLDVPLATIESRGVRGKMRVRFTYFEDSRCTKMRTIDVPFDLGEGLCCRIGLSECSANGPPGGWAPTEARCDERALDEDAYYEQRLDPWGCPRLEYDGTRCCNCVPEDAGIGE